MKDKSMKDGKKKKEVKKKKDDKKKMPMKDGYM